MSKRTNAVLSKVLSKVSMSLPLKADCVCDRTQGLLDRFLSITSCCTDRVQLALQSLCRVLDMLGRRLATCILQQCRRRSSRIPLQRLDGAPHRGMVVTNQRREAAIPRLALVVSAIVAVQRRKQARVVVIQLSSY